MFRCVVRKQLGWRAQQPRVDFQFYPFERIIRLAKGDYGADGQIKLSQVEFNLLFSILFNGTFMASPSSKHPSHSKHGPRGEKGKIRYFAQDLPQSMFDTSLTVCCVRFFCVLA